MKKLLTVLFLFAFAFTTYAGGGAVENAKATNYKEVLKQIEYPQVCREKGIEGQVLVLLRIGKNGQIKSYKIKSAPCSDLEVAVENSLPFLTFEPGRDGNGKAVSSKVVLPVNFKLTI